MINPTKANLKKLEQILIDIGYRVLYEKGSFQSGYCLVDHNKTVVINKYLETKSRVNTILDIISRLNIDETQLTAASLKTFILVSKQFEKSLE